MKKVIWVNGCFDVLHVGHIELFKYAKSLGDRLIVGIDSDERVNYLKGEGRPFNNSDDRATMLNAIKYINQVVTFDTEKDLADCVKLFNIDILVVGSDYKGKKVVGSENAKEVMFFNKIGGYSTTKILNDGIS